MVKLNVCLQSPQEEAAAGRVWPSRSSSAHCGAQSMFAGWHLWALRCRGLGRSVLWRGAAPQLRADEFPVLSC